MNTDRPYADIGARILKLRTDAGMTQEELTAKLGGAGNLLVNNWEAGRVLPSTAKLMKMHDIFGVSIDWILYG